MTHNPNDAETNRGMSTPPVYTGNFADVAYADTAGTHKQSVHKHDKNVYTNETKLGNRAENL